MKSTKRVRQIRSLVRVERRHLQWGMLHRLGMVLDEIPKARALGKPHSTR